MPVEFEFEEGTAMTAADLSLRGSKRVGFDDSGMILAATRGGELVLKADDGVLRVLPSESFVDAAGCRIHVADVQGQREAFVLVVEVREDDGSIVSVRKIC